MTFPKIDPEYSIDFVDDMNDIDRLDAWDEFTAKAVPCAKEKVSSMADLNRSDLFGGTQPEASSHTDSAPRREAPDAWSEVEQEAKVESEAIEQRSIGEWNQFFDQTHFVGFHGPNFVVYQETEQDDRKTLQRVNDSAFKKFHANKVVSIIGNDGKPKNVSVAQHWLNTTSKRYEQLVFNPMGNHRPEHYNLWQGFGLEPRPYDEERIKIITDDLILDSLCSSDQASAEYLLNWLAHGVQFPAIKPGVAVVLRGPEGTGKGTLGRLMLKCWGTHGITVSHSKHLTGNFNAHLRTAVFVFSDEAQFVGDAAGNQVLKALITEDLAIFERKGIDADLQRNFIRVLMATNSDWVVNVGSDARRYFVIEVSDKMQGMATEDSRAFWRRINDYIDAGGGAEFLDYLLKRGVTNFTPQVFPQTEALARQRAHSLDPVTEFLVNAIYAGTLCCTSQDVWEIREINVRKSTFYNDVIDRAKTRGIRQQNISIESVGRTLKKYGIRSTRVRVGKEQPNHYVFPPREELAKRLIEVAKLPKDMFDPTDETDD